MLLSDKDIVEGLINEDESGEKYFREKYREQIIQIFTMTHGCLEIKKELTHDKEEELFQALCENLHSSDNKQLKDLLSDGRKINLSNYLMAKANSFSRDKFLVEGLKNLDKDITKRVMFGYEDDIGLQRIMKTKLKHNDVRDFEHGGEPLSSENMASEAYEMLMDALNRDIFRFEGNLTAYFSSCTMRTYISDYFKQKVKIHSEISFDDVENHNVSTDEDEDDSINVSILDIPDAIGYERDELEDFFKGLFKYMPKHGATQREVDMLHDRYYGNMKNPQIAEKWNMPVGTVATILCRAEVKLRKLGREYNNIYYKK